MADNRDKDENLTGAASGTVKQSEQKLMQEHAEKLKREKHAARPWWKKKRWWISLIAFIPLIYILAYIAEDELIDHAEKYIVSIDGNFDNFYESIELTDEFSECRFYKVYYVYDYKTCLRSYQSTLSDQSFEYVYWRPRRILRPGSIFYSHNTPRDLIAINDGKLRYQKYGWKEAPDESN